MNKKTALGRFLCRTLSYLLVAVVASVITLALWGEKYEKLSQLKDVIQKNFIGQADMQKAEDAAAAAMVQALGDRWSYYISAEDYAAHVENKNNAYVGIGITIVSDKETKGFVIKSVTPGGSAQKAGILPGDILVQAQGQDVTALTSDEVKNIIRGEAGTQVTVAVLREGEQISFTLERREIKVAVATGTLLDGVIGYVRIANFNTNCAEQTIAAVKSLQEQGAQKLIFDVRNNPGGYVNEMIKVLDYLLPEGVLFRELDNKGREGERRSDADCLELPIAVLVNGSSYSAAEFFAAALDEYDWATVVGEKTTGKGHYQNTLKLADGSAVNLSTGKYFTPNGVNLTEAGGLTPDVTVEVDEETAGMIYAQLLSPVEDPQLQAAVEAVTKNQ